MKTYSIGRDVNCDIVINDSTDVISRRHALLNVTPSGKMTIIDQSSNGTYVNGIRISPNVPVPITRKDTISLAHVAKLDWAMVPKTYEPVKYVAIGIAALLVIAGSAFGIKTFRDKTPEPQDNVVVGDTIKMNQAQLDSIELAQLKDSLQKQQIKDSLHRDSVKKAEQKRKEDAKKSRKKAKEQAKDTTKKEETKKPSQTMKQDVG